MSQQKENVKRVKRRTAVKSSKENLLKTESKRSQKRISRVDTILDEIMKERKSTVLSPSPLVKLKSEYSVDALVEEVTGKLRDIGNLDSISNIRRTRKRAQSVIKKEKDIEYQEEKKINNREDFISKISSKPEPFNENLPVFYNQEEVDSNEWIQVNGQDGVFVKKNFRMHNISNGFVKIEAKCSLQLHSVRSQIFSVAEGRGIFVYDNDNMKVKLGPGQTVTIPPGFPCIIINSGLKKNLVFTFVKIYGE